MDAPPQGADPALEQVLFYQIEQAMRQSVRYTHRIFSDADIDLTKDQWLILKKVNDVPDGVPPLVLANVLGKEAASMTRMLDILERKELVERQPNPEDRRSSLIYATKQGKALFERVIPLVKDIRSQAVKNISDAELDQFKRTLRRITENLE